MSFNCLIIISIGRRTRRRVKETFKPPRPTPLGTTVNCHMSAAEGARGEGGDQLFYS